MTTRHRLSGSRVALGTHCLYWARPDVALPVDMGSDSARLGSAVHELIAGAKRAQVVQRWSLADHELEDVEELHAVWSAWWAEHAPVGVVQCEAPYAWDCDRWTARRLPSAGPRDYSAAGQRELTCTVDCVRVIDPPGATDAFQPELHVYDWKTGHGQLGRAQDNLQLATGALCAARTVGWTGDVQVHLVHLAEDGVRADSATLTDEDLDAHALVLCRMLDALPTAEPVPGPWCSTHYCPALSVCEGPRALARRAPELAAALPVVIETEEQAAAVLLATKPLQAYLDGLKASAVAWALAHGGRVRLPDGRVMARVSQTRRTLDCERIGVLEVLAQLPGGLPALTKAKVSASVTAVERAAESLGQPGRTKAAAQSRREARERVMRALEASGGVRVTSYETWEEE